MPFQAVLLSIVILISLLISGTHFSSLKSSAESAAPAQEKKSEFVESTNAFLKDLSIALGEKADLVNQNINAVNQDLNKNLSNAQQNLAIIGANLSLGAETLNQNLAVAKENLSAALVNLVTQSAESNSQNSSSTDASAVAAESKINNDSSSVCRPDASTFNSQALLVKYFDYNSNIFESNADKRWPIASLTKLMTAIVAIEKMDLDKQIVMTENAVAAEGTAGDFKVGEVFTVRDLIKSMLVVSSNDAAVAIANSFGEKDFINEMQKKSSELQMFQTTYLEPTGLSSVNESTINDLTKLISYIYFNHPEILEISRQKQVEILDLKSQKPRELINIDKFAGEPDFIGGKTGYIDEAGRNFLGLFEINSKTVLTITLGADDCFKETQKLKDLVNSCQ